MSVRLPLPIRLLQSTVASSARSDVRHCGGHVSAPSLLFPYKPSGLPVFSASQVASATRSSDGTLAVRQLLTLGDDSARLTPDDTSDSLFSRLGDALAPGTQPYLALSVVAPALAQSATGLEQELVTALLAREKGLMVLAPSLAHAFFVRNAEQLGLVRLRFHVLCALPDDFAANARTHARHFADRAGQRHGARRNPYMHAHLAQLRKQDPIGEMWQMGVPVSARQTQQIRLDALAQDSRLVRGGLFDCQRGVLLSRGQLEAEVGLPPLSPAAAVSVSTSGALPQQQQQHQRKRLNNLFQTPSAHVGHVRSTSPPFAHRHPWLAPEGILTVLPADVSSPGGGGARPGHRRVSLDFRLLNISGQAGNALALYDVSGNATAEEVRAVFHSEGCTVVNDFTRDLALATAMQDMAELVRNVIKSPSSAVASLPARTQHQLRQASPETLVWGPLASWSTHASDYAALQNSQLGQDRQTRTAAETTTTDVTTSELSERVHRYLDLPSRARDGTVRSLLWSALERVAQTSSTKHGSAPSASPLSPASLARVLGLSLGSGVECCGVTLPDPAHGPNVLAMQHLVNRLNSPRGGIAAHTASHVADVSEQMKMLTVGLHGGSAGAGGGAVVAQYGVSPLFSRGADETGVIGPGDDDDTHVGLVGDTPSYAVSGQTCFTFAFALQLPGLGLPAHTQNKASEASAATDASVRAVVPTSGWAPSLAHVLALTDVPAAFAPLISAWQQEAAAAATPSPLVVSRWQHAHTQSGAATSVETRATAEASQRHNSDDDGGPQQATPLIVRIEELAELSCALCGARGHVWATCETTTNTGLARAQLPPAPRPQGLAAPESATTDGSHPDAHDAALLAQASRTAFESRLMLRVDDVVSALDHASPGSHPAASSSLVGGPNEDLVRVPNRSPTSPLNLHALRHEQQKPAIHRRTLRCAYCHGRHHITACPQLADSSTSASLTASHSSGSRDSRGGEPLLTEAEITALAKSAPEALFCIKCGEAGHLFFQCPQIPADVHPATHCPICLRSQSTSSRPHTPEQCPRAVKAPSEFSPRGVARQVLAEREHMQRERTARRRQQHRQHRGSMLIADSFVDRR